MREGYHVRFGCKNCMNEFINCNKDGIYICPVCNAEYIPIGINHVKMSKKGKLVNRPYKGWYNL